MPHSSRVALITGCGKPVGIGNSTARALAAKGVAVIVSDVRPAGVANEHNAPGDLDTNWGGVDSLVEEIAKAGGTASAALGDVSQEADARRMVEEVLSRYGRLDILVNNAAVRDEAEFGQLDYASWRHAMSVCLDGAFHCTQAALALLQESRNGSVINIGGLTAHTGASHRVHVVTAKAGLVGMTRALAHELAPSGITVNCLSPGLIDTQRHGAAPAPNHHATRTNLVGRRGQPSEIGEAVLWLAGAGGRYVTGQTIHLNGGAYLGG
jgi:3-oxoacyl-[acyl-carrier protein] reductase